jgi:dTDP-4-amino-4,6-dideoxygalactose transaminase
MAIAQVQMNVPFVDLGAQHQELRSGIEAVFAQAIDTSIFVGGPMVHNFEQHFAEYCGVEAAAGVADGTHALMLALHAAGVGRDDIVLTVSHTFIATAEAIVQCGAHPIFLEIDPKAYTLDPATVANWIVTHCYRDIEGCWRERASERRVKAVVPVHLYGLPADMEAILAIAAEFRLQVIEDACQAHGAWYTFTDGTRKRAGAIGDAGCFSFYPGKNLGAMGEGGAVVTNRPEIAQSVRMLRDHGQIERYVHCTRYGINARLDAIQAGVLDVKLARLEEWNERRRAIARIYDTEFAPAPEIVTPSVPAYAHHVYHLYVILVPERNKVQQRLRELGVATGLHYPIPVHLQEAFADQGLQRGSMPITEHVADTLLSLPMFPHMSDVQIEYVVDAVRKSV